MRLGIVLTLNQFLLTYNLEFLGQQQAHIHSMSIKLPLQHLKNNPYTQHLIRLITHRWQVTCRCSAVTPTSVTRVLTTPCAADLTGQYVRHLLEPAFSSVPTAAEIPALFESALRISGLFLAYMFSICLLVLCGLWCVQHPWTVFVLCYWFVSINVACQHFVTKFMQRTSNAGM